MSRINGLELGGLAKCAETTRHLAMRLDLDQVAAEVGYPVQFEYPGGLRPDVCRLGVADGHRLAFVGDSKVAWNEPPTRPATRARLLTYFVVFARLVRQGAIDGGVLAVVVDNLFTALQWKVTLAKMARICGLDGLVGVPVDFNVIPLESGAFVVGWRAHGCSPLPQQ